MKFFKKIHIIAFIMIGLLSSMFIGCGSSKNLSLDSLLKNLQNGDISKAKNLMIKSSNDENFKLYDLNSISNDIEKSYYKKITFKVVKMEEQDKTANAKVKFEYPDMNDLNQKAFKEIFKDKEAISVDDSNKKIVENIVNNLNNDSFKKIDKEIDLEFEKGSDDWLIKFNEDLNSVLCKPLNDIYIVCDGTKYTVEGLKALKNLDVDWFKKNSDGFKNESIDEESKKYMKYLANISKRDKISFNDYKIEEDSLSINTIIKAPDISKLYKDNYDEIEEKFMAQATEANAEEVSFKLISDYLNNKKFDII
uniref:hypothetical protein n=1 Tax=Clostridium perfringens TaxID=1502 RepID=UPI0039EA73EB